MSDARNESALTHPDDTARTKAIRDLRMSLDRLESSTDGNIARQNYLVVEGKLFDMESIFGKSMVVGAMNEMGLGALSRAIDLMDYSLGDAFHEFLSANTIASLIEKHEKTQMEIPNLLLGVLFDPEEHMLREQRLKEILDAVFMQDAALKSLLKWLLSLPFRGLPDLLEKVDQGDATCHGEDILDTEDTRFGFILLAGIRIVDEEAFDWFMEKMIDPVTERKRDSQKDDYVPLLADETSGMKAVGDKESGAGEDKKDEEWL